MPVKLGLKTRISLGGIYHITDIFSKLGFENLLNPCWTDAETVARHSAMEAFWALYSLTTFAVESPKHRKALYQCIESPKTSQYINFSHKKKCCGIKVLSFCYFQRFTNINVWMPSLCYVRMDILFTRCAI